MYIGYSEAETFLRNCKDAVIITHQNPDGDCIGAGFGLKDILAELGIRSRVVCSDEFPPRYDFMTNTGAGEDFEPQTVIAVDIADTRLMGKYQEIYGDKVQLCIDHHISNTGYAEKTLLRPKASAACEVIYDLAKFMGVNISRHCAMCLYTGIATDSGCFKYESTTANTHEIAAEMKRCYDIDFAKINRMMFEIKTKARMILESKFIGLMEEYLDSRLVIVAVTLDMMNEIGVNADEFEGLAPMTIQLEGTEVGVLMKEREKGIFRCSFRSADKVNVSEICKSLGGGGHAKASGCTIEGCTPDEAKNLIIETVRKAMQ
ncbi:MAG: bifunctional oligoribonuclease/PAP phosphatase NrnA [Ruminococcus flavefaciens]|nr:bifunctional oligoribonuclease/PAP phosphatase NrnA [Ruminococcus flavefaciens]MCM1228939.1 bifunctional oligoribonuclease/PAP phosphatase NrnA [Ruminococcus flavefaciens]